MPIRRRTGWPSNGEIEPLILVGIANTGLRRMAEYTPTRDFKMGGGEGRSYGRLLIEELKPWIDRTYRTLPDAKNTGLGGSSLGGLISLYVGFAHPEVFGKLAVMSPSLWWDHRSILNAIEQQATKPDLRIWLDMGTAEGCEASAGHGYAGAVAVKARLAERSGSGLRRRRRGLFTMNGPGPTVLGTCCVSCFLPDCGVFCRVIALRKAAFSAILRCWVKSVRLLSPIEDGEALWNSN